MPISVSQLRRTKWTLAFEYDETTPPRASFSIYINAIVPKLTMVHIRHPGGQGDTAKMARTEIQYRSHGRKAPTLADAVRLHNAEEERQERASRGETGYRPKTARRRKTAVL